MSQKINLRGSAAAVTGAASGIGRALAVELAARGCHLALADVDAPGLEAVCSEIAAAFVVRVTQQRVDVGDPMQIEDFAQRAVASFPALNILVNNAGVALRGDFDEYDQTQMEWLMDINFWGVVRGTRAFMPHLKRQPAAHIVNLSSIFGIVAPAGQSAYCSAKFAVRGFSESLRHELAMSKSTVSLTLVHPGGIATNIARRAPAGSSLRNPMSAEEVGNRFAKLARTSPQAAAQGIVRAIERKEPRLLIGADAKFMEILQRLRPVTYWSLLMGALQRLDKSKP